VYVPRGALTFEDAGDGGARGVQHTHARHLVRLPLAFERELGVVSQLAKATTLARAPLTLVHLACAPSAVRGGRGGGGSGSNGGGGGEIERAMLAGRQARAEPRASALPVRTVDPGVHAVPVELAVREHAPQLRAVHEHIQSKACDEAVAELALVPRAVGELVHAVALAVVALALA
jgi:hypothetical protein